MAHLGVGITPWGSSLLSRDPRVPEQLLQQGQVPLGVCVLGLLLQVRRPLAGQPPQALRPRCAHPPVGWGTPAGPWCLRGQELNGRWAPVRGEHVGGLHLGLLR